MKLVRYGLPGQERPGLIDSQGNIRSLYPLLRDFVAQELSADFLASLRALDTEKLPLVQDEPLSAPVSAIRQVLAIGLNYLDHIEEAGMAVPEFPVLFNKSVGSLSGPTDPILAPKAAKELDWELELGVLIGSKASHVELANALDHVAGYCVTLDMSERIWQLKRGGQFGKGKSYDGFTPIGPWLVTAEDLTAPQNLGMKLSVNGEVKQDGNTKDMVFGIAELISHLSNYQTLLPGDLILTGTPAGVAFGMEKPIYLKQGDIVECEIELLGSQRHIIGKI